MTLHVVGLVRRPLDLGVRGNFGGIGSFTPAFYEKYRDQIGTFVGNLLRIRTKRGAADVPATIAAGRRIFGDSLIMVESVASETSGASDAIDVLTIALWIFAGSPRRRRASPRSGSSRLRQLGANDGTRRRSPRSA